MEIIKMTRLYVKEKNAIGLKVNGPKDVLPFFKNLEKADQESAWVISLDAEHKILACDMVALGGPNYATVSPNIVFRRVLQAGGISFIFLHNHPSGNPTASEEDKDITKKLREGGKLVELRLLDSLIIAERGNTSISVY